MRRCARFTAVWLVFAVMAIAGCATLGFLETVEALLQQGKELYQAGRYDEALAKFQEVIKREPKSWAAYLYAARTYIAKAAWAPAIDNGRKAYELAPQGQDVMAVFADALVGGGEDALRRGDYTEAISRMTEYVRLKPTDARGYLSLGRAFLGSGRYVDALNALVQGVRQEGDSDVRRQLTAALLEGGRQALGQGDLRSGIGFLKEYVQLDPRDAQAYLDLGKALWQEGSRGDAVSAFRRVLELSPGHEEALRFIMGGQSR